MLLNLIAPISCKQFSKSKMLVTLPCKPMAHGFLFLLILLSSFISTNIHACKQTERSSLLSFSLALSSPPLNWTSVDCCRWQGITCDRDGSVTHLLLPSEGLKGGIFPSSSSLGNLTHLTHLNLSHNSLYGSLETKFFSSLSSLEILDLSYNLLSGELPVALSSRNIRTMDLSSNHFHGEIPSSFFHQAWNLTSFNVSNNTFSGSIPTSVCLHSSPFIRLLDFTFNKFNGSISRGFGECSKLKTFRAGYNNLSGLLPNDIYYVTKLEEISFPSNSLYGAMSDRIVNLTNLEILDLSFNQFSGILPLHFGQLSKLRIITLDFNNLEGSLPQSLMNCTNLIELHMGVNHFEGDISMLNFSKLSKLTKLDLVANNFTGILPISIYSCRSLEAIRLSKNHLEGQIQPEIVSLKSLSFLSLAFNRLTNVTGAMKILKGCRSLQTLLLTASFNGEGIPGGDGMVEFDGFQNLQYLSLSSCQLTGEIPTWLSKRKNLEILDLNDNKITGSIPSWLGTLPRLFNIDLSNNLISGEFPKELCGLPSLVYVPTSAAQVDHKYDLELPVFNGTVKNPNFLPRRLSYFPPLIALSGNNISGPIPAEIGQLQLLHKLDLHANKFSGNIPDQISNLKNLEVLDLSMNHLSGTIPSSLARLNFLNKFDVSYNSLEGTIPTSTQLQSFNASAFQGNPRLCGAPLPHKCGPNKGVGAENKQNQEKDNGHEFPWFYIFVVLGFFVGFWGVCGYLIINKTWRYAYFRFIDNVQDRLFLMMTARMKMIKRKIRG